jgi:hypothetical protein
VESIAYPRTSGQLFLLSTLWLLGCHQRTSPPTLRLAELWTIVVPDGSSVLGALPLSSQAVVLWFGSSTLVCYGPHGVKWSLTTPDSAELVDVLSDSSGSGLRVVDARNNRLLAVDTSGVARGTKALALGRDERIIEAAQVGPDILLGTLDTVTTLYRIIRLAPSGPTEVWGVGAPRASVADPPFRLSALSGEGIVAETTYPFGLMAIQANGRVSTLKITGPPLPRDPAGEASMWRALRLVDLGEGSTQSYSLLSGDSRRLIRYTKDWDRVTNVELDAPFAAVSSRVMTHTLVAARSVNGLEIVVYTWEWRP